MDLAQVRGGLQALIQGSGLPVAEVSRGAIDGVPALPAVVIGQPRIDLTKTAPCMTELTLPVAVVAGRDATDDQAVIDLLDSLLVQLVAVLDGGTALPGVNDWRPTQTQFTANFQIGAAQFPAHLVFLTLHCR